MKITIEIDDRRVTEALEDVHARYWASDLSVADWIWTLVEREGDGGTPVTHTFNRLDAAKALKLMIERGRPEAMGVIRGETDGPARDVFLQFIVFGELKYG